MNNESYDDAPMVAKCDQCKGPAYLCEQPDSTCRLKQHAAMWLAAGGMGTPGADSTIEANARKLAPLLRQVEDGAWSRLSEARTRHIKEAEARVAELEHIEDTVLACQKMLDANEPYEAVIDRLLTIYIDGAMKRDLKKRQTPSVCPSQGRDD